MIPKVHWRDLSFVFFGMFLISLTFSVTISQGFAILSILCYLLFQFRKFSDLPLLFLTGISLYIWILLVAVYRQNDSSMSLWYKITHSEFSDIWILLILLPARSFSQKQRKRIRTLLRYSAILLIIFGLVSFLFPYRLSTYIMDGFAYLEGRRLPHLIAEIPIIRWNIYLPIGIQNTHLTYGGLLALFLPILFFDILTFFRIRFSKLNFKLYTVYPMTLFFCFGILLLFFNQSRSIWIGLFLGFCLTIDFKKAIKLIRKKSIMIVSLFALISLLLFLLFQYNWLFQRSIQQLFAKQTLENQRIWIHKANIANLTKRPFIGVGSGNYKETFESVYEPILSEMPYLFYEISITPKSHAHHDFLHFFVLGGVVAGIIFLFFWLIILFHLLNDRKFNPSLVGAYAIFIGGLFQCYFLDDEVLLPLLAIVSLKLKKLDTSRFATRKLIPAIFVLIVPISVSIIYTIYMIRLHPKDLFVHRTRQANNTLSIQAQKTINGKPIEIESEVEQFYFKLEGCLTHFSTFRQTPKARMEPLQLNILLPEENSEDVSYPNRYEMEIRIRDTFDQDRFFKVHSESVIGISSGSLFKGRNEIQMKVTDLPRYEEIKFYDFGIRYYYEKKKEKKMLPAIHLNANCD